jgi:hypothetical protein
VLNVSAGIVNQPNSGNLTGGTIIAGTLAIINSTEHVVGGQGHPVGVTYNNTLGRVTLTAQATAATALSLDLTADLNTVECAACHYVHQHADDTSPFLRIANNNSQICLACHNL